MKKPYLTYEDRQMIVISKRIYDRYHTAFLIEKLKRDIGRAFEPIFLKLSKLLS
jgi:hypothetical protein